MEPEPMTREGGYCAPIPPLFDPRPQLDPVRLKRAADAAAKWITSLDPEDDDYEALARVVITEYERVRLMDSLPAMSVERGAIKFMVPGEFKPPTRWQRVKWANERRYARIAAPYRRLTAARKRLSDARAVWHGTKEALSDAEIENLSEY